jgi:hypothetical protein
MQARLHYGFIFAHSTVVQNTAGAHPRGIEVEITRQRVDTIAWDLCRCYPVKGWSFSYFDYNTNILGQGITTAYFLEPAYRMDNKTQLRFRGSVGLSYLTNPYHPERNPTNQSYSMRVNGFLQLGIGAAYQVTPKMVFQLGAQYQHISNGGFKDPNKGINWPTASAGISWYRQRYHLPLYKRLREKGWKENKPYMEAGFLLGAKQGFQPGGETERTPLAGVLLQRTKQVSGSNALNAGIEIYYDNALKQRLQKDSINGSAYRAGILAGHDFLLGRFFFSQQLGVYIHNNNPYFNRLYHRWALRYRFREKWMLGFALNAHRQVADFIDVRLMYRL